MPENDGGKSPYWFPAKRYGWGWGPPTVWQGWAATFLWIALLVVAVAVFRESPIILIASFLVLVVLFQILCWLKGEPPRWRWGGKD